jgi:hypothetical protein
MDGGQTLTKFVCGAQNFERIVIEPRGPPPYRTDFIACAECRVMCFSPEPPPPAKWVDVMPAFTPGKQSMSMD